MNKSYIKMLKKYMKTDEIPSKNEVINKFDEDNDKSKKKFYMLVLRVVILNILLYVITLIYKYFMVFHIDRLFFNKDWENKKIDEY